MGNVPPVFKRFLSQLWYAVGMALFFFVFIFVYTPLESRSFLDAGRGLFAFNLTMVSCILLLCLLITRVIYYYIWRKRDLVLLGYAAWTCMEFVISAMFVSLYMWLISRRAMPYFQYVDDCVLLVSLSLIFPCLIAVLSLYLNDRNRGEAEVESQLVRFNDENQRQKLVIASSAILFIEADENYVRVYYLEGDTQKEYLLRNSMKGIDALVSKHGLVRCHRSYFVNPEHVKVLRKEKEGVILAELDLSTKAIPVSKKYYEQLSALL